jgi:hypothetical protein
MSNPSRPARALPAVPNLEQQRKLARELLEAVRAHDPGALARVRTHHPRFAVEQTAEPDLAGLSLHDAQLVLAREYGFPSWPKLKTHIDAVVVSRRTYPLERKLSYYDDRAHGLLTVLADGAPSTPGAGARVASGIRRRSGRDDSRGGCRRDLHPRRRAAGLRTRARLRHLGPAR